MVPPGHLELVASWGPLFVILPGAHKGLELPLCHETLCHDNNITNNSLHVLNSVDILLRYVQSTSLIMPLLTTPKGVNNT